MLAQETYSLKDKIDDISQEIREMRTQDVKEMRQDINQNRIDINSLKIYITVIGAVATFLGAFLSQVFSRIITTKKNGFPANNQVPFQSSKK